MSVHTGAEGGGGGGGGGGGVQWKKKGGGGGGVQPLGAFCIKILKRRCDATYVCFTIL